MMLSQLIFSSTFTSTIIVLIHILSVFYCITAIWSTFVDFMLYKKIIKYYY